MRAGIDKIASSNRVVFAADLIVHVCNQYQGRDFPAGAVYEDIMRTVGGLTHEEFVLAVALVKHKLKFVPPDFLVMNRIVPRRRDGDTRYATFGVPKLVRRKSRRDPSPSCTTNQKTSTAAT